jgi:molybdenum cofactor cytidylyltransferase
MSAQPRVDGVILAAGLSARMSQPKPLLQVGTETFLERAAGTLRDAGCTHTYVVANADATWLAHAESLGLDVVINAQPDSEQVDSLRLVIAQLAPVVQAVLVLPIDLPLVSGDTARALVEAFQSARAPLVLPFHNGVAGHPVLIARALFDDVLDPTLEEGVRSLIMKHSGAMHEVRVTDPGILIDIDTPDDYWRYIEQK